MARYVVAACTYFWIAVPSSGNILSVQHNDTISYKSVELCRWKVPFQSHRCHSRISEHMDESWSQSSPPFGPLWQNTACLSLPCACKTQTSSNKSLALITNIILFYLLLVICSSYCTSLSPASSACGHHSRNGYQWQYSWGRPHWWTKGKEMIKMKVVRKKIVVSSSHKSNTGRGLNLI